MYIISNRFFYALNLVVDKLRKGLFDKKIYLSIIYVLKENKTFNFMKKKASRRSILKKLRKSHVMKEAQELDYTKDGEAIISIGLQATGDFFHPYSFKSYDFMNPEIIEYIDMCESSIPIQDNICLDIYTEEATTNVEKKRIRETVKRHNAEQAVSVEKNLKGQIWLGTILCIIGILILVGKILLWDVFYNSMLDTLIDIIGWVFLWDGSEIFIFDVPPLKKQQLRSYRLMNAKVHVRQYDRKIKRLYHIGMEEEEEE